jgi:hypothetical protein
MLRVRRLLSVQEEQEPISQALCGSCGYLNFVTDSRNDLYLHFYVGQATVLLFRLYNHASSILKGKYDTFHYFMLQLGGGFRTANWLYLWRIPEKLELLPPHRCLLQNFAEMLCCRAFQSLPQPTLEPFFGPFSVEYVHLGYNLLSPLLQGRLLFHHLREDARLQLLRSHDPEYRFWPAIRNTQLVKAMNSTQHKARVLIGSVNIERTTPETISKILEDLFQQAKLTQLSDHADPALKRFRSLRASFNNTFDIDEERRRYLPGFTISVSPSGRRDSAKLCIVMDHGSLEQIDGFPKVLASVGFHSQNSLVCTYNHTPLGVFDANKPDVSDVEVSGRFFCRLINFSHIKVVLLFGKMSEKTILDSFNTCGPYTFTLRGEDITVWLQSESDEQGEFKSVTIAQERDQSPVRIFDRAPEIFGMGLLSDPAQRHLLGEIFSFVSLLTATPLRCYIFENSAVLSRIFRQIFAQKHSIPIEPITAENIDPVIQRFLWRKGFTFDDILELEKITGSLCRSVHILLHVLPKRPGHIKIKDNPSSQDKSRARDKKTEPKLVKQQIESVQMLYHKVNKRFYRDDSIVSSKGDSPYILLVSEQLELLDSGADSGCPDTVSELGIANSSNDSETMISDNGKDIILDRQQDFEPLPLPDDNID